MEIIAHRGFSGMYPENTKLAFEEALKLPIQMIEIDVHLSSDDQIIVTHDYDLVKFGVNKLVRECSYNQIKTIDVGSWFNEEYHFLRMQTLRETLETIDRKCQLLIELKGNQALYPNLSELIWKCIQETDSVDSVIIQSFNDHHLYQMHNYSGDRLKVFKLIEGFSHNYYFDDNWRHGSLDKYSMFDGICPNIKTSSLDSIGYIKSITNESYSWTVNSKEEMEKARLIGLNGVITDFPDKALEFYKY